MSESPFNRAIEAVRQPGSTIKPAPRLRRT